MSDPPAPFRAFGPFTVSWVPKGSGTGDPSVVVRICVLGQLLWDAELAVTSPTSTFSAQLNAYSVAGIIGVSWLDPQAVNGQLTGTNCSFTAPDQQLTFAGTIGVW